ncbi:starch-binding protein [Corallincola spongiicola]|uniref:Alpha-amylase n=1 Tax=Corallincola spongiicola TaxID=2520508 RepID=A0ABY1WSG0_9GAMM|nr:starch-binding protein [Corallincola spongiicola]TAA47508.1 starch-binding protein [Corallincola spongiicola]
MLPKTIRQSLIGVVGASVLSISAQAAAEPRTAFVHLFEWQWKDIAIECEEELGPKGFSAVQVSPPNEHVQGDAWWTRYQPVSYKIDNSRSGTRAEFIDMINRCSAVGVEIYVDAVVNHMAGGGGTGTAGSSFSSPNTYPDYGAAQMHQNNCDITPEDYGTSAWRVRNCSIPGLPDLATEREDVRNTIAGYMNEMISLGVTGFRIDAAKHMEPADVEAIQAKLSAPAYIFQEVIDLGGEKISRDEYTGFADVTEFQYSAKIGDTFKNGQLSWLANFGSPWGFMADDKAVVFTDNHDNQRGHGAGGANVLTFKDGALYDLANVYMLAWPYGYPKVMSSYQFGDINDKVQTDMGPPGVPVHDGNNLNCFADQWKCEHRWRPIANMVSFRNFTAGSAVSNWWDNGGNQIAFGRSGKGFVVINREAGVINQSFATGMAAGTYCDVVNSDFDKDTGQCDGTEITVDAAGNASFTVAAFTASAIHVGASSTGICTDCGGFNWDNAYLRGTSNGWATTALAQNSETGLWEVNATFAADNPRFKITRFADWTEAYPAEDFLITEGAGDYLVTFNDATQAISATKQTVIIDPDPIDIAANSICYDNEAGFNTPTVHYWAAAPAGSLAASDWPGATMVALGDYYCHDFAVELSSVNLIFSDSGANQGAELNSTGQGCYQNGAWSTLEACNFKIVVPKIAPIADAGADITIYAGDTANFDGSASYDSDGDIVSWAWSNTLTGETTSRIYDTAGTYVVTLTVTDNDGLTATAQVTVTVITVPMNDNSTLYFKNSLGFNTPTAHLFDAVPVASVADTAWPGVTLASEGGDWYSHDFGTHVESVGVVFSNSGANQTLDQTFTHEAPCYQDGAWVTMEQCEFGQPKDYNYPEGRAIYFYNADGWATPTAYTWNETPAGSVVSDGWPGKALTEFGDNLYFLDISAAAVSSNVIFSDAGNNQTTDQVFTGANNCYKQGEWMTEEACGVPSPLSANGGGDRTVNINGTVTLSADGSVGDIASYAWTSSAWGTLNGAQVTTPALTNEGDLSVTLTVTATDGKTATDSFTISVVDSGYGLASRPLLAAPLNFPTSGQVSNGNYGFENAFPNLEGLFGAAVLVLHDGFNDLLYVVDKPGRVYAFPNREDVTQLEVKTVLDIRGVVRDNHEQGLLGLAFDPDFANNGYFYVYYNYGLNDDSSDGGVYGDAILERWTMDNPANPTAAIAGSKAEVLRVPQFGPDHKGGMLQFHPTEGYLYLSIGDGAYGHSATQSFPEDPRTNNSPQETDNLRGSIIRIEVLDIPEAGKYYRVPGDNPFVGDPNVLDEIWSYGHRNPWRWAFDTVAPYTLWETEVGQQGYEEVNIIQPGQNYGWPICEGVINRGALGGDGTSNLDCNSDFVPPVGGFYHTGSSSIIGGFVYRGSNLPGLNGRFIFGDYNSKLIWSIAEGEEKVVLSDAFPENIASFGTGLDGSDLFITTYGVEFGDGSSRIYKAVDQNIEQAVVPAKLSQTGIFSDLAQRIPVSGVVAYELNSDAWFDGSIVRHYMAIPNDQVIGFSDDGNWTFPVGTVLVKQIEVTIDADGNTRPLNTAVLFKQEAGWEAANYKWNDSYTDADLVAEFETINVTEWVDGALVSRERVIRTGNECASCHVGNGSKEPLAMFTRQLNGDMQYPNMLDNQLRTLNFIGMFDQNISGPASYPAYVDPADTSEDVNERAYTYMDTNCAHCHQSEGFMDLRYETPIGAKNIVGVATSGDLFRVDPFHPENSVVYVFQTTDGNRMPKGSKYTNPLALSLFDQWISAQNAIVTGLQLNVSSLTPELGATVSLSVSDLFDNGFTAPVTDSVIWNSSDPSILDVSGFSAASLQLTTLAQGEVTLMATVGGASDSITLVVGNGPAKPTHFSALALSTSAISLTWNDNADDESNYLLYRRLQPNDTWELLVELESDTISHVDSGLIADTAYYYQLVANNAEGSSPAVFSSVSTKSGSSGIYDALTIVPGAVTLLAGGTQQLVAVGETADSRDGITYDVTWSIADTNIATVDASGLVTGGSVAGTTTLTITTLEGDETSVDVVNQGEGFYVYFQQPGDWAEASMYTWYGPQGGETKGLGDWPGTSMEAAPEYGGLWKRQLIKEEFFGGSNNVNLIFNCGSAECQTDNLVLTRGSTNVWFADNAWLAQAPEVDGAPAGTQVQVQNGRISLPGSTVNLTSKLFVPGTVADIVAIDAGPGQRFSGWEGTGIALLLDPNSAATKLVIEDTVSLTLLAVFESIEDTHKAGREQYQAMCASCHGSEGGGYPNLINIASRMTLEDLADYIEVSMPKGNVGACVGDCATEVAAMVFEEAYKVPDELCDADSLNDMVPPDRGFRLLTAYEYNNSIRDLLGLTNDINVTDSVPQDIAVNGFKTDANAVFTNEHVSGYLDAAELAADMVTSLNDLAPECSGETDCIINSFGKRAFRRPLTATEFAQLKSLHSAEGDKGLLTGIFSSPLMLYRSEVGEEITSGDREGFFELTDYEVAGLLSYTFWATTPDATLMSAADAGQLSSSSQIQVQVERLLADDKAKLAFDRFIEGWLGTNREIDGQVSESLKESMREETHHFVREIVFSGGSYNELMTADYSYMNQELAAHYGLSWPGGNGWQKVTYTGDNSDRAGILGHAFTLAASANGEATHPVKRGLFVRRNLMCQDFPPPPVGAELKPVTDPSKTVRERFETHIQEPCAACHQYIDGIGFGLESYDNRGLFRTTETTADGTVKPVDASGYIGSLASAETFLTASDPIYNFSSMTELSGLIADSRHGKACFARQWYRATRGQREERDDSCTLQVFGDQFKQADSERSILELMVDMTQTQNYILRK